MPAIVGLLVVEVDISLESFCISDTKYKKEEEDELAPQV